MGAKNVDLHISATDNSGEFSSFLFWHSPFTGDYDLTSTFCHFTRAQIPKDAFQKYKYLYLSSDHLKDVI